MNGSYWRTGGTRSRQRLIETIRSRNILNEYPGVLLEGSSTHPRHPYSGRAKYAALDIEDSLPKVAPSEDILLDQKDDFRED